ncbi:hypothetical protein [Agromyces sp. GXQ0307]|uniref:hypothetical protein n=1 Tax=Agromyces sp. GXQ0307 TaxID=3377835 RepID=UPI00383B5842
MGVDPLPSPDALANGQPIGDVVGVPTCVALGETFTVVLEDVQSCVTNIVLGITVDGATTETVVSATNIPGGSESECATLRGEDDVPE